jgi:hypothetical protein
MMQDANPSVKKFVRLVSATLRGNYALNIKESRLLLKTMSAVLEMSGN